MVTDERTLALPTRPSRLLREVAQPLLDFFTGPYAELEPDPQVANFAVGNPHEVAMPAYVDAVARHLPPQDQDWFAFKMSEPDAR